MANLEYKLPFTGSEIEAKLNSIQGSDGGLVAKKVFTDCASAFAWMYENDNKVFRVRIAVSAMGIEMCFTNFTTVNYGDWQEVWGSALVPRFGGEESNAYFKWINFCLAAEQIKADVGRTVYFDGTSAELDETQISSIPAEMWGAAGVSFEAYYVTE